MWALEYGMSKEDVDKLLLSQNNLCKICLVDISKTFHVDHCHSSGTVRGLLCNQCNTGLGLFKDSEDNLSRAIDYLRSSRSSN